MRLFLNSIVCISLCMRVTFVSGVFPGGNAIFGREPGVPEPDTTCPVPLHDDHTSSSQCTIYLISTKIIIAASLCPAVENGKVEEERRLAAIIIFVDSSGYRPRACIGS